MEITQIINLVKDRITEISVLILERKLYTKEFEKFIDIAMDSDWAEANYEVIDSYPTALNPWKPTKNDTNCTIMQHRNTYAISAELTITNNGIEELSGIQLDLEYNSQKNSLIFYKIHCP